MITRNDKQAEHSIRLFKIYKKIPKEFINEFKLILTEEIVLNIESRHCNQNTYEMFVEVLNELDATSIKTMIKILYYENHSQHTVRFMRALGQLEVFLKLRPELIENYPELLI